MAEKKSINAIIKESDFRRQVKSSPKSCYFFFGEEDYMKKFALDTAKELLVPDRSLSMFNEIQISALDFSPQKLISAIMPMPVMAERKLIYVTSLDVDSMKAADFEELCNVLLTLSDYNYNTVIISAAADGFNYGSLPRRPSAKLNSIAALAIPVYFERNTPARLAAWVGKHYLHNGVGASAQVCEYTVSHCGCDMFRLSSETDKISYYVLSKGKNEVNAEDVDRASTASVEFDAFALTNAIISRNRRLALAIFTDMKSKKTDPVVIMSEITNTSCNLYAVSLMLKEGLTNVEISKKLGIHSYAVSLLAKNAGGGEDCRRLIEMCRDADLDIKMSADGYSTIEALICRL